MDIQSGINKLQQYPLLVVYLSITFVAYLYITNTANLQTNTSKHKYKG